MHSAARGIIWRSRAYSGAKAGRAGCIRIRWFRNCEWRAGGRISARSARNCPTRPTTTCILFHLVCLRGPCVVCARILDMKLFFYGPNTYALRKQVMQMVGAYVAKAGSDLGLVRIDGAAASVQELTAALEAVPFLASSRLVIVEGVVANKAVAGQLAGLLARVPDTTVAVFVEREVDQRTAAFKTLKTCDRVVKFEPLSGVRLPAWVRDEAGRLGGRMDAQAARVLVDLAGEDQWRLAEELNKLVNYDPQVTPATVQALVVPGIERSIFDLVESMTSGRSSEALHQYRELLAQKQSEIYVLTMIQWQLRNLLLAKTAPAGLSPGELAQAAGLSPFVAGKAVAARGRVSEPALVAAFRLAAACEYDIKPGRKPAEAAVEHLIWRGCG